MVFKLNSNHHKTSYMVCRSLLGVHRAHFHQKIIFPATSGRMPINFEKHQKFKKSPKIRFFAKIRFLMEWPILAGMMIYGRNRLLGCQKVFFNQILIYTSLLNVFLKNRKKSIFHIFFQDFLAKIRPKIRPIGRKSAK